MPGSAADNEGVTRFRRLLAIASVSVLGLMVPAAVHGAPAVDRGYVVQPGDYLFGIAHQQGVALGDLLAANGLTLTSVIHPGQRLVVPARATSSPVGGGRYTVRPGDSLFGIARRLGVSPRSLLAANGLALTSVIHPGQRLVIPTRAASSSGGSPASPNPASPQAVERIIRDVWPDALEGTAVAIAWRESRFEARAQGQCCSGLFQIYYDVHKGWLADLGIDSRQDLYDPRTNAEAAFALYRRAGWSPWSLAGD
jgi:LysM repeat protein